MRRSASAVQGPTFAGRRSDTLGSFSKCDIGARACRLRRRKEPASYKMYEKLRK